MEPDKMVDGLLQEISEIQKRMAKAKKAEDKLIYSEILKNLCSSFKDLIGVVQSMMMSDIDDDWDDLDDDWDDFDNETIPF